MKTPKPSNDKLLIFRESYMEICGDIGSAFLLSYLGYWHDIKSEQVKKHGHLNDVAEAHGDGRYNEEHLYQYHSVKELHSEMFGIVAVKKIASARKNLIEKGFISEHKNPNPKYKFDKTVFFLVHPEKIEESLEILKKSSSRQNDVTPENNDSSLRQNGITVTSECRDGNVNMPRTITETTSEITSENLLKKKQKDSVDLIDHLNKISGKKYKAVDSNLKLIEARLSDGYTVEEVKFVIENKYQDWKDKKGQTGSTNMWKYYRPSTLFNATKFEAYVNEDDMRQTSSSVIEEKCSKAVEEFDSSIRSGRTMVSALSSRTDYERAYLILIGKVDAGQWYQQAIADFGVEAVEIFKQVAIALNMSPDSKPREEYVETQLDLPTEGPIHPF